MILQIIFKYGKSPNCNTMDCSHNSIYSHCPKEEIDAIKTIWYVKYKTYFVFKENPSAFLAKIFRVDTKKTNVNAGIPLMKLE